MLRGAPRRPSSFAAVRPGAACLFGLLLLLTLAAPLGAQGLGDAASRERARRRAGADEEKRAAPARVFTNDDLSTSGDEAGAETAGEDAATEDSAAGPAGSDREPDAEFRERVDRERAERASREREWRARFAEARARVREEEAKGWREVVRTELYQGIPVQMKVREFVETEEYRQAKRDLADLQEEFRRTGLPPGWARE